MRRPDVCDEGQFSYGPTPSKVLLASKHGSAPKARRPLRVLLVFGTRPESIKFAPIIAELRRHPSVESHICVTGQHRQMLDEVLTLFGITPDSDLDIMRPNQSLGDVTTAVLTALDRLLAREQPDWVLVQGDTTTTLAASLAAFYRRIPVAHVEAGLRTYDKEHPWPEEVNRRMTSVIAERHYAPTERARDNLFTEGVPDSNILVTGNTATDALLSTVEQLSSDDDLAISVARKYRWIDSNKSLVLVTGHRRESFGQGFEDICQALVRLARRGDVQIVYPVHLNPQVRCTVHAMLMGIENIRLIEPVSYLDFVYLMQQAKLILTDSGGVQEEAPSLGKPVLVMRDTSERQEAIDAGVARLVGTEPNRIVSSVADLLDNPRAYARMSRAVNPFGDGRAAQRIVGDLLYQGLAKPSTQSTAAGFSSRAIAVNGYLEETT